MKTWPEERDPVETFVKEGIDRTRSPKAWGSPPTTSTPSWMRSWVSCWAWANAGMKLSVLPWRTSRLLSRGVMNPLTTTGFPRLESLTIHVYDIDTQSMQSVTNKIRELGRLQNLTLKGKEIGSLLCRVFD